MYKVKQKGVTFLEKSAVKIDKTFQLKMTAEDFWEILIDYENWKDWFPNFKACYEVKKSANGIGSQRFVDDGNLKVIEQITTWNPPYQWGFDVAEINIPLLAYMTELVTIKRMDSENIKVHWQIGGALKWWAKPVQSKLVNDLDKSFDQMILNLKNKK